MIEELEKLCASAQSEIAAAADAQALDGVRIRFFSRNGELTKLAERLKDVPPAEKPVAGKKLNETKGILSRLFDEKQSELEVAKQNSSVDFSLPGRPLTTGRLHPITQTVRLMTDIFRRMGFSLAEGPNIETEWNNFDALNTPADHPARNEKDTFYIATPPHPTEGRHLLRTQTSPVQIRVMKTQKPPVRIICPGRCFRRDEIDATHGTSFHQVEGLVVGEDVTLADLKGTLEFCFRELLGQGTQVRFRPHFFPFTEPSFEVDFKLTGAARGKEWLEIAGCGMVDPRVFEAVGYDAEKFTGYAFGMGIERIAMILHGVNDLRLFEQNDVRFLSQF